MIFDKKIEFSIHPDLKDIKIIQPKPTKKILPDWFKKLDKHSITYKNIKGCVPFIDNISAGYILPLPQDLYIGHNVVDKTSDNPEPTHFYQFSLHDMFSSNLEYNLNGSNADIHPINQVGGENSFMGLKNGNANVIKILNPWRIKTPPGYSCLFRTPDYTENDYFHIISAIVDTDVFDMHINFPIIINNDKYKSFEKLFKQGTSYVQIIPFKRDSWKHEISTYVRSKSQKGYLEYFTTTINRYRDAVWKKKSWK